MFRRTLSALTALLVFACGAGAQMSQQANATPATALHVTTSSAEAKAEFWVGLDDWQNFGWTTGQHHFERALALDSTFGLARVFVADAAVMRGYPLDARALERGVLDAARASTEEGLIALAWREKANGHDRPTAMLLHAAMELMPDEQHLASEYLWSLSAVDLKAARDSGRALRSRFPAFGSLGPPLIYVLMQSGDTAAAIAEARRYSELAPTQPASFVYYGRLLQMQGRYAEAEVQYRQSLKLGPKHAIDPYNAVTALAEILVLQGNTAAARQAMTDALARATSTYDSVQYFQTRAGAELMLGDQRAALESYAAIDRVWPPLADSMGFNVAPIYEALTNAIFGDRRSVGKYAAVIHVLTPRDTVPFEMSLANIYAYAGEADSTTKYADKLAARASANAIAGQVAHFARGELYLQTHRCKMALEEFRQSDPTTVEVQQGIAECELQLGHREAGLRWRDRVLAAREVNLLDPGEIHARLRAAQLR